LLASKLFIWGSREKTRERKTPGGSTARNCEKLESLNKRALRIAFGDEVSSYQQLLHNSGGATLYNQRIPNMLIFIYKCLNSESFPKYLKDILTLRQSVYSSRRTNILSLCKPATTTYGPNSFHYFASKKWNSLPNNVRSEPTLSESSLLSDVTVYLTFFIYVNTFLCI